MKDIYAVRPESGRVVHLHQPGYLPGKRPRSLMAETTLCNVGISRRSVKVPLRDALGWPNPDVATAVRPPHSWSWCRVCVGHAASIAGLCHDVLVRVAAEAVAS